MHEPFPDQFSYRTLTETLTEENNPIIPYPLLYTLFLYF